MSSNPEADAPEKKESTARRDRLIEIEHIVGKQWAQDKIFETDAPSSPEELAASNEIGKYMATFPYPYMNGAMHLGHAFTLMKAEFMVRYQRLQGKRVLFPFGFHCTGMPIAACADKLKKEIAQFGCPPVFPAPPAPPKEEEEEEETPAAPAAPGSTAPAAPKLRKKKGKLAGKTSKETYQWNIMKEMGIPESEIHKFQDAHYWLQYFPPIAVKDLTDFGLAIDWRRSFITTVANPYYDAFIKWQFRRLFELGKVKFGKRVCIYSPLEKQACADHDRASGETVGPQAYSLVKLRMVEPFPEELVAMVEKLGLTIRPSVEAQAPGADSTSDGVVPPPPRQVDVILPAATLRPETMYGQTNLFVLPTGDYSVYVRGGSVQGGADNEAKSSSSAVGPAEILITSERSALNMAHQDIFTDFTSALSAEDNEALKTAAKYEFGVCANRCIGKIKGQTLMGCAVAAPLAAYKKVHVLPLLTISMSKGTGVVTSVPSDAGADYAALMDLKNKPALREKFGIKPEHVMPFEVINVLNIPGYGDQAAVTLCQEMKVASQNDTEKLDIIKEKIYTLGFAKGTMIVGPYKGTAVSVAKPLIKNFMVERGLAIDYSEPESLVMSRSGVECVSALIDQWYLTYGEPTWRTQIADYVSGATMDLGNGTYTDAFNAFNSKVQGKLLGTINWMVEWACSRSYGLGTMLPDFAADPKGTKDSEYLIESLSDSTIYMAYYTIAHLLQPGSLDGKTPNPGLLKVEDVNDELFDYVFMGKEAPENTSIPKETLEKMRKEFEFWYPFDLRVSGKDLLNNHLVMSLYNHAAIFGLQPRPSPSVASGAEEESKAVPPPSSTKTTEGVDPLNYRFMPRGIYANGLLTIDGEKMSKSTGNFLTVRDSLVAFGADATRFALASAGDGLEDANFSKTVVNNAILRLSKEEIWIQDIYNNTDSSKLRPADSPLLFWDQLALARIDVAITNVKEAYEQMRLYDVMKLGAHTFCNERDAYRTACIETNVPMHPTVVRRWADVFVVIMSPIVPFWAQHMWENVLKRSGESKYIYNARWPQSGPPSLLIRQADYITSAIVSCRSVAERARTVFAKRAGLGKAAKGQKAPEGGKGVNLIKSLTIKVAAEYSQWQVDVLKRLNQFVADEIKRDAEATAAADAAAASVRSADDTPVVTKERTQGWALSDTKSVMSAIKEMHPTPSYPDLTPAKINEIIAKTTAKLQALRSAPAPSAATTTSTAAPAAAGDASAAPAAPAADGKKKPEVELTEEEFKIGKELVAHKKRLTDVMAFASNVAKDYQVRGADALELTLPFSEVEVLKEHLAYVLRGVDNLTPAETTVELYVSDGSGEGGPTPGKPQFVFKDE